MSTYKTPGVYVEEISTLAPSVVGVATAVPAFIGLTYKASKKVLDNVPDIDAAITLVGNETPTDETKELQQILTDAKKSVEESDSKAAIISLDLAKTKTLLYQ